MVEQGAHLPPVRKNPAAHSVQTELVAVLHVRALRQKGTGEHVAQTEAPPAGVWL